MIKVSLICATLNASATIENLLKSVITQEFKNYELIIVDGGSTDTTLEILSTYQLPKLTIISEKDKGIYDAMNKGIAKATGDWILFIGADDRLANKNIFTLINKTAKYNDEADGLYGNVLMGYTSNKLFKSKFSAILLFFNSLHHQGIVYNRRVFSDYRYKTNYKISADYELNLLLYLKKAHLIYINSIISIVGDQGISSKVHYIGYQEEIQIRKDLLESKFISFFLNLLTQMRYYVKRYIMSN